MKKLLMILVSIALLLPLYAQETETAEQPETTGEELLAEGLEEDSEEEEEEAEPEEPKKPFTYAREKFEFGSDLGIGFSNDLIGMTDFFKKNIEIDLDKVDDLLGDDGLNLNLGVDSGLFLNIMNIPIKDGLWDFGIFSGADGNIHGNIPQSLFSLMSEGNLKKRSFKGMISASGGIFANVGLRASAKYGKLRVGARPALYTPIIFIPKSGINYQLNTEDDISLETSGKIDVYYPIDEEGNFTGLQFGFDMSLEGEYELFSFLDVGASFSSIPIAPAQMKNGMHLTMSNFDFNIKGDDLMAGKDVSDMLDFGKLEFERDYSDVAPYKVFRPLRLDVYANYKPLSSEILALIVKPNLGFSVNINNKQGYFNAGLVGQLSIQDMFFVYLGTGNQEAIWKHRLGLALNLRAVKLGLEASLQSQDFVGSFKAQGFGFNLGMSFGW